METEEILVAIQKAAETIAKPNCAAWLSVGVAAGTLVVAIIVAIMQYIIYKKQNKIANEQTKISKKQVEISEQQNKIALLEKRIVIYNIAHCCKIIAENILESAKNNREAVGLFQSTVVKSPFISTTLNINREYVGEADIKIILDQLAQAEFLFSKEVSKSLVALAARLLFLMLSNNEEEFNIHKDLLCQLLECIEKDKIFEKVKDELQLKSEVDICPSPNPPTNPL